MQRADGVVLSTTEVDEHGEGNVFGGEGVAEQIGARVGNTTVQVDPGGVLRHFFVSYDGPGELPRGRRRSGDRESRSTAARREPTSPWIDYRGPPGTFESYSFSDVLRGKVPDGAFRGKTVVVGATAPSLQDFVATPGERRPRNARPGNARQRDLDRGERLPAEVGPRLAQRHC